MRPSPLVRPRSIRSRRFITTRRWLHHSPQEAGESGDRGVHGDAHVGHRQAEHQEIAGGPQLPHFEEGDDRHRVEEEAQQTLWWEEINKA